MDDTTLFDTLTRLKYVSPVYAQAIAEHIGARAQQLTKLRAALELIAAKSGMALLGGSECADPERAFQLGANRAFEDCASIAKEALSDDERLASGDQK